MIAVRLLKDILSPTGRCKASAGAVALTDAWDVGVETTPLYLPWHKNKVIAPTADLQRLRFGVWDAEARGYMMDNGSPLSWSSPQEASKALGGLEGLCLVEIVDGPWMPPVAWKSNEPVLSSDVQALLERSP